MGAREIYVDGILSCAGLPYIWGANGPDSFDCSGLVCYNLRRAGIKINDHTSQQIYDTFSNYELSAPGTAIPGCLFFYGAGRRNITHVMTCVRRWKTGTLVLCGARSGGSTTTTIEKAAIDLASVDLVWGGYWKSNLTVIVDPFRGHP